MNRPSALLTIVVVAALALPGCASTPAGTAAAAPPNKADPWENFNRRVYAFNDVLDRNVVKPVAEGYRKVVPQLVRTGVNNVLGNIGDVWSTANHFLQGKLQTGLEMGMRVLSNTFFGIGGILDPATEFGLIKRPEDFGQTLGRWGIGPGPYLVLPLLGPSTLRDTVALPADRYFSPGQLPSDADVRLAVTTVEVVNARTNLLDTTQLLDEAALDRYSFTRDAYLARRLDQVYDGSPPLENFDDDASKPEDLKAGGAAAAPPSAASAPSRPAPPSAASAPSGSASAPGR